MATAFDVAKFLLYLDFVEEGSEGLSNMKLQKLAYYSQGFHLAIFDKPLFDSTIEAWVHGPVVVDLYHYYKLYDRNSIPFEGDISKIALTRKESNLIKKVYEVFGRYSAAQLRKLTHQEPLWKKHESRAGVITEDEMKVYFKTRLK